MTVFYPDPRRDFFDQLAHQWESMTGDYTESPVFGEWLKSSGLATGQRVLEIGCGAGRVLPRIQNTVGKKGAPVGLDLSFEMLQIARFRCAGLPVGLLQAEAWRLPFTSHSFDQVLIMNTFPHLQPVKEVLSEIQRILCRDGLLHITHFGSRERINHIHSSSTGPIKEDLLAPAKELATTLEQEGFSVLTCLENEMIYDIKCRSATA